MMPNTIKVGKSFGSQPSSVKQCEEDELIQAAVAQTLACQREKFNSTEKTLDEIDYSFAVNQRHLDGFKIVLGNARNYFAGILSDPKSNLIENTDSKLTIPSASQNYPGNKNTKCLENANLSAVGVDIATAVQADGQQLDRIAVKIEKTDIRIKNATQRLERLLKK